MPTLTGTKPFKSYDEQIALLKSRGLIINNDETAKDILKRMNYYRLSAYSLTLRKNDQFYPGVSIEDIVSLYDFDADLRKIIFEFSEIAETSARAYIAYYYAQKYGPLGYLNNQNFESELNHSIFLKELFSAIKRSSDIFVIHHKEDLEGIYPVWVAIEETTFGALSKFYKNMDRHGNTSAASIPIALHEMVENDLLHPGQTLACIGFGGGLTWGGMLLTYEGRK